jgi:hypothetical protein
MEAIVWAKFGDGGLGSHSVDQAQDHPSRCKCLPFYHSNESPLAQKSRFHHNPNLSNGIGDNSRIKTNKGEICPDCAINSILQFWQHDSQNQD